jgi:hypothetical protein
MKNHDLARVLIGALVVAVVFLVFLMPAYKAINGAFAAVIQPMQHVGEDAAGRIR